MAKSLRLPGVCSLIALALLATACTTGDREGLDGSVENQSSSSPTSTDFDWVTIETIAEDEVNTEFYIEPRIRPQIAQSVSVDRDMELWKVTFFPNSGTGAPPEYWTIPNPRNQPLAYPVSNGDVGVIATVSIWRLKPSKALADDIDLLRMDTPLYRQVSYEPIALGPKWEISMKNMVELPAGEYLIVLGLEVDDKALTTLRFQGRQSGKSKIGADGQLKNCTYEFSDDTYPQGKAFAGLGASPNDWGYDKYVHFGTSFVTVQAKVDECTGQGKYGGVTNQGDLRVRLFGRTVGQADPKARSQWGRSVEAALPKGEYQGLACDPFSAKIKGVPLPDGAGPEARVAAACMLNDWMSGQRNSVPEITVLSAPTVKDKWVVNIRRSIAAGDKLFGKYGSSNRRYEFLLSDNPEWSCTTGLQRYEKKLRARYDSWRVTQNSGCNGAQYQPGAATARNLGANGETYLSWTLRDPAENSGDEANSWGGWGENLRFVNHEYVHGIQVQKVLKAAGSSTGLNDFPPSWFGEGQAQWLSYNATGFMNWPEDNRARAMKEMLAEMEKLGITEVDFATVDKVSPLDLVYSAGYFAHEYLTAHYGSERVWDLWTTFSKCSGASNCFEQTVSKRLGLNYSELIKRLNAYVNAQVQTQKSN